MRKTLVVLATVALWLLGASPTHADSRPTLDEEIDQVLTQFPGGVRVAANVIEWEGGAVTLTLEAPGAFAPMSVGSCATGSYCAYSGANLSGSKLSFTTCNTTVSTAALGGVVRSIANARSSGSVQARNSSGTTLATISAGGQLNSAPGGVSHLRCTT
jgi:hypothetical protein